MLTMSSIRNHMDASTLAQFQQYNHELNNACQRTAEDFTLAQWLGLFNIDEYYALLNEFGKMNLNDQDKDQMGSGELHLL